MPVKWFHATLTPTPQWHWEYKCDVHDWHSVESVEALNHLMSHRLAPGEAGKTLQTLVIMERRRCGLKDLPARPVPPALVESVLEPTDNDKFLRACLILGMIERERREHEAS